MSKLKRGAGVIVQPSDQAMIDDKRHAYRCEYLLHLGKMCPAGLVKKIIHAGQTLNN